jgi:hypothetical protein
MSLRPVTVLLRTQWVVRVYSCGLLLFRYEKSIEHGEMMKTRTGLLTLALCFAGTLSCLAQNAQIGTWKLNEAKSKIPAGFMKNTNVVYEAAGDNIKASTDGIDKDGKPFHTEWTGKFDGKDYPLTGDPTSDARSYKTINDHTLAIANKKGGTVTTSGKIVVSADGKSRTLDVKGTDAAGKNVSSRAVYDKQ